MYINLISVYLLYYLFHVHRKLHREFIIIEQYLQIFIRVDVKLKILFWKYFIHNHNIRYRIFPFFFLNCTRN